MADEVKNAAEAANEQASNEAKVETLKPLEVKPGMVVRVHQKIKEVTPKGDERERIQIFEGLVIAIKGKDLRSRTITVRKIASGVGVERIFPIQSPVVAKIEAVKQMAVRRSKLYFTRKSKKKLVEKKAK